MSKILYVVKSEYSESRKNHSIVETWRGLTADETKKVLGEIFDIQVGSDGIPVEPSLTTLTEALSAYADSHTISDMYSRMTEMHEKYTKIEKNMFGKVGTSFLEMKLDDRTTVSIEVQSDRKPAE